MHNIFVSYRRFCDIIIIAFCDISSTDWDITISDLCWGQFLLELELKDFEQKENLELLYFEHN